MKISLTAQDLWELIGAILAIVTGIYLMFHQQEVSDYFINAFLKQFSSV